MQVPGDNAKALWLCYGVALLLVVMVSTILNPASARVVASSYCNSKSLFHDDGLSHCCGAHDFSCSANFYFSPGFGSMPLDPFDSQLCLRLDLRRRVDGCANDPGATGFDLNQKFSPIEFRSMGERIALVFVSVFAPARGVSDIFAQQTACYATGNKRACDQVFASALIGTCEKEITVLFRSADLLLPPGVGAIVRSAKCLFAARELSLTMNPGVHGFLDPILGSRAVAMSTLGAAGILRGFLNWHTSKYHSVHTAATCNADYSKMRAVGCIP